MGAFLREHDWSASPLGPPAQWPRALKTAVTLMLQASQPTYVAWGAEQVILYNDGYVPLVGTRHPAGLGQPAAKLWSQIWDTLGPVMAAVLAGQVRRIENQPFTPPGRDEDPRFFSFSYTPIWDYDDRVAGVFCAAMETTDKVVAERRSRTERDRLTSLFERSPAFVALLEGPEHRFGLVNPTYSRLVGQRDVLGKTVAEALPETVAQGYIGVLDEVYRSGRPYSTTGARYAAQSEPTGPVDERFLDFVYQPMTDATGTVTGIFVEGYDVTERVRAEMALRASEERYRTLFDVIDEGFCIIEAADRDGASGHRFLAANPAFAAMTGGNDVAGRTLEDAFPESSHEWTAVIDAAADGGAVRFERASLAPGRVLELFVTRIEGQPRHTAVVLNDITARKRAETFRQALVELGERIRDLGDPQDLSFAAAEILGRTLGVSRAGYGTVDKAAETILIERDWNAPGIASIAGTLHFRDYGSYIEQLKRGETAIVADSDTDPRTEATSAMLKAISAQSFVNMPVTEQGGFVALLFLNNATPRDWAADELALVREVAERTRTAVARLVAERDLKALANSLEGKVAARTAERDRVWRNSRDLLVVVGADGIFRAINPAWEAILGHAPAQVVGHSFRDFIWPEDAELTQAGLDRAAAALDLTNFENRYRHKDGTPRWISWRTSVEGGLVYAYGRDVTAEKEQARALAEAEEALRQSQKMEAVGQLTGGVAHDFNNMLTIIRSSVDFLRRPDLPEDRRRRYMDAVSDTVDRAAKLTGQLLAFARRQALQPETMDVGERLRSVADMLDTIMGARIRVAIEVPAEPCYIRVDPSQFETALVNMAVNARDAMDGEGTLTLRLSGPCPMPAIRGHAGTARDFVAVSITDTGCGIAGEDLVRIFEPFFTTKEVGRGTGLGLSQVIGFAKQSGGDVDVASDLGQGSTFTLYLPQVEAPSNESHPETSADAEPSRAKLRVLVVEDNLEVGRFCTQILEDLGHGTVWAKDAETALVELEAASAPFDAVFSDVVMPGMGGIALAQRLRETHPELPVILASGYSHVLAQDDAHGFELVRKPYSAEQVSQALHKVKAQDRRRHASAPELG